MFVVGATARAAAAELATEIGATNVATLAEVTAASDTIITVVTNDDAMRAIFTADNLLAGTEGKTFINCATLSPGIHREVEVAVNGVGAIRSGRYKLIEYYENGTVQLFDLENDIGERNNLAASHPEIAQKLQKMLHD